MAQKEQQQTQSAKRPGEDQSRKNIGMRGELSDKSLDKIAGGCRKAGGEQ